MRYTPGGTDNVNAPAESVVVRTVAGPDAVTDAPETAAPPGVRIVPVIVDPVACAIISSPRATIVDAPKNTANTNRKASRDNVCMTVW
jgi:hypothetical protein